MAKTKTDPIYRVGDYVKVVNPEIFIRCGYPLCIKDVTDGFTPEQVKSVVDLLVDRFGVTPRCRAAFSITKATDEFRDLLERIAYHAMKSKGFGGDRRQIFTETKPEYKDAIFRVDRKFVVKTGDYQAESGSYSSYCGEYDYCPPELCNVETHVILCLSQVYNYEGASRFPFDCGYIEIEERNVTKVQKTTIDKSFGYRVDKYEEMMGAMK